MKKKRTKKKSDLFGYKALIVFCVVAVLMLTSIFYVGIHAKPVGQDNPTAGSVPICPKSEGRHAVPSNTRTG